MCAERLYSYSYWVLSAHGDKCAVKLKFCSQVNKVFKRY
jgi:hypothetical protein